MAVPAEAMEVAAGEIEMLLVARDDLLDRMERDAQNVEELISRVVLDDLLIARSQRKYARCGTWRPCLRDGDDPCREP